MSKLCCSSIIHVRTCCIVLLWAAHWEQSGESVCCCVCIICWDPPVYQFCNGCSSMHILTSHVALWSFKSTCCIFCIQIPVRMYRILTISTHTVWLIGQILPRTYSWRDLPMNNICYRTFLHTVRVELWRIMLKRESQSTPSNDRHMRYVPSTLPPCTYTYMEYQNIHIT